MQRRPLQTDAIITHMRCLIFAFANDWEVMRCQ